MHNKKLQKHTQCLTDLPPCPGHSCGGAQQTVQVEETNTFLVESISYINAYIRLFLKRTKQWGEDINKLEFPEDIFPTPKKKEKSIWTSDMDMQKKQTLSEVYLKKHTSEIHFQKHLSSLLPYFVWYSLFSFMNN